MISRVLNRVYPASAGEPATGSVNRKLNKVYPRVCGGTQVRRQRKDCLMGLSPRLRGNQLGFGHFNSEDRSIPVPPG